MKVNVLQFQLAIDLIDSDHIVLISKNSTIILLLHVELSPVIKLPDFWIIVIVISRWRALRRICCT